MKQFTIKRSKFHKLFGMIFILIAGAGMGVGIYEKDIWVALAWLNVLMVVAIYELEIKLLRQRERDIE